MEPLDGGKVVQVASLGVYPDMFYLVIEKNGKYYRLRADGIIHVKEINKEDVGESDYK